MDRFTHSFLLTQSRHGINEFLRRCLLKLTVKLWVKQQIQWRKDVILAFIIIYNKTVSFILTLYGDNDNKNLLKYSTPFGKCSCMAYGLQQAASDLSARLSAGSVTD